MSNDIKGYGNSNTAEFWEYDTRLGRRWNLDLRPTVGVSEYSAFINSPIWISDPLGDTTIKGQKYEAKDMKHATYLAQVEVTAKVKPKSEAQFTDWYSSRRQQYHNQVDAYRAWQSYPGEHKGEGKWDRMFRKMAYGSMEARRDYASGGMNMYGGAGRVANTADKLFTVDPNKFAYFFGKVVTGEAKNIARSAQNLKDLTQLGITTEEGLMNLFNQAIKSGTTASTQTTQYGTSVLKSVTIGEKGSISVGFFYEGGNMSTIPKVTSVIPKIF